MTSREALAFRILASLYPDSKPSKIRAIIEKAKEEQVCEDDIELWAAMTSTEKEPETKVIKEEHHYHHYDHISLPYTTWTCTNEVKENPSFPEVYCGSDGAAFSCNNTSEFQGIVITARNDVTY